MNYLESIAYIESLSPAMQHPCLERIAAFMDEHGRPQDRFESIHVGGTNGKGSTVAMLDTTLRSAGLKVGRFTGPHLLRWNERFHVGGEPIEDDQFARLAAKVRAQSEEFGTRHPEFGALTWFELLTAMAFTYFAERAVDVAVMEVGLGGRWDATNVLAAPLASAITNVDLDHTHILGDTVRKIAMEKAGIIKKGTPVVTAATGEALEEIISTSTAVGAPVFQCVPPGTVLPHPDGRFGNPAGLRFLPRLLECRSKLSLAGGYQQLNALVSLSVLLVSGLAECYARGEILSRRGIASRAGQPLYFSPSGHVQPGNGDSLCSKIEGRCELFQDKVRGGNGVHDDATLLSHLISDAFGKVYWPGRLQYLEDLNLVLDGAHNPAGAHALRSALDELFPGRQFLFVMGCFQNKNVPSLIHELVRSGDRVIACEAASRRAVFPARQIADIAAAKHAGAECAPTVEQALEKAAAGYRADEVVVATGSFAIVREVMLSLGWQRVEDGRSSTRMSWQQAACKATKNS